MAEGMIDDRQHYVHVEDTDESDSVLPDLDEEDESPRPIKVKLPAKRNGPKEKKPRQKWPEAVKTQVRKLREKGLTFGEILSHETTPEGVKRSSVVDWCQGRRMKTSGRQPIFREKEEATFVKHINLNARLANGFTSQKRIQTEVKKILKDSKRSEILKDGKPSKFLFFYF